MARLRQSKNIILKRQLHTIITKKEYDLLMLLGGGYLNKGITKVIQIAEAKEVTVNVITELKV